MDNQVVPKLSGKLTKCKIGVLPQSNLNLSKYCQCTYPVMLVLGCFSCQSPDSEFIQSHDRFVGFRSIRQKHHNYEAQ